MSKPHSLFSAVGRCYDVLEDPESLLFFKLTSAFTLMISLSCYVEEWIYKVLPGFDFYWTVACVELACFALGATVQRRAFDGAGAQRRAPLRLYVVAAVSVALSQAFGKVAFKYLNYPTGTILKSGKLLPTMALNLCWLQREVPWPKWVAAVLLVASASFMALGEQSVEFHFHPLGLVFSALNLFFAALQGNLQESILKDHDASIAEALLYTNGIGMLVVASVMVAIGELVPAVEYFVSSPQALLLLGVRSVTFFFGGVAGNALTKEFGTSTATAVGTARKTLTVLLSFALFPKPLDIKYLYGVVCFLAAEAVYLLQSAYGKRPAEAARPQSGDYEMVGKGQPAEEQA